MKYLLFIFLVIAGFEVQADDTALVKDAIKTYEQIEDLNKQKSKASETEIEQLRTLQKEKAELVKAKEDDKVKELAKKEEELQIMIIEKQKPFNDQIKAIKDSKKEQSELFKEAMQKYFRISKEFPEITKVTVNPQFTSAIIFVDWYDKDDKKVFWSHVRIRPRPQNISKKLDDKYPIQGLSDNSFWLWAGNFEPAFVPATDAYKGQDTLIKAVKALIDLESLQEIEGDSDTIQTAK